MNQALKQIQQYAKLLEKQPNRWAMLLKLGAVGLVADLTPAEAGAVKRFRKRIHPQVGQCYANAQEVAYTFPHSKAKYVEGYYVPYETGIATEHAWLKLNGKVIDLTYPGKADYFGVEIPWRLVRRYLLDGESHGPMLNDYWLGWKYTALLLDPDGSARAWPSLSTRER